MPLPFSPAGSGGFHRRRNSRDGRGRINRNTTENVRTPREVAGKRVPMEPPHFAPKGGLIENGRKEPQFSQGNPMMKGHSNRNVVCTVCDEFSGEFLWWEKKWKTYKQTNKQTKIAGQQLPRWLIDIDDPSIHKELTNGLILCEEGVNAPWPESSTNWFFFTKNRLKPGASLNQIAFFSLNICLMATRNPARKPVEGKGRILSHCLRRVL